MTSYEFVFSNQPGIRAGRHVAFWSILILHFIIQNLMVGGVNEALKPRSFVDSGFNALFFFPVYVLATYTLIDYLLPAFLFPHKYRVFFSLLIGMLLFNLLICSTAGMFYIHIVRHVPFNQITFNSNKYNILVNGMFFPITIFGIAGGITLSKKWYFQQVENGHLAREKIARELQLLKTQLHPKFLFHSLQTINARIRALSPFATGLIIQLSELLSYTLYESDKEFVQIGKEIEIVRSYIELERMGLGERLAVEIDVSGEEAGKFISPLLLLSFIEVIFECNLTGYLVDPSIRLMIRIWSDRLDYHLICNNFLYSHSDPVETKARFVGLQRQLNYLYPDNHKIEILTNYSDIVVLLNIPVIQDGVENKKS